MGTLISMRECIFSKHIEGFGRIQLRPIHIENDLEIIFQWLKQPKYDYCVYKDYTLKDFYSAYIKILASPHRDICVGLHDGEPIFLMEKFKVIHDDISKYVDTLESDYGMRFMVGPTLVPVHGFTWYALSTIMDYFFSYIGINRVITDFDSGDNKYKVLNKRAGFKHLKTIQKYDKEIYLSSCNRIDYEVAKNNVEKVDLMINTTILE